MPTTQKHGPYKRSADLCRKYFSKAFGTAAQDSYMESQDTYTPLFADQAKYNAVMRALGTILHREMRNA